MKRFMIGMIAVVLIAVLSVGCTQRIGDFTLVSTKNVDIGGKYKKLDGRFEGVDAKPFILGFPIGIPNLKTAVDNCIENGKGDLITNAVIELSYWTIILYGEQKYIVKGDVWTKASTSDLRNPNTELYDLQANANGYELVSTMDPTMTVKVDYFAFQLLR